MALKMEHTLAGYDEAATGAVVYRVPDPGYLRIGGADRGAFVQRQTTNDVQTLTPGRVLLTVLPSGRRVFSTCGGWCWSPMRTGSARSRCRGAARSRRGICKAGYSSWTK